MDSDLRPWPMACVAQAGDSHAEGTAGSVTSLLIFQIQSHCKVHAGQFSLGTGLSHGPQVKFENVKGNG